MTATHSLWLCQLLVPYVDRFLKQTCRVKDQIGILQYIFWVKSNIELNHIFIEFKKEEFYNFHRKIGVEAFCQRMINKIRN